MNKTKAALPVTLLVLASGLPAALSQEEPGVVELRGDQLTVEALVEALRPEGPPPPELLRARGESGGDSPIRCSKYQEPSSRGMEAKVPTGPNEKTVAVEVLFDFDSAELRDRFTSPLDKLGEALTSGALALSCFRIEGHTDSLGTEEYNLDLSRRRARTVVEYLTARFDVDPGRLSLVGYGEQRPIADNDTSEGRQRNRRVQVVNLGWGATE